MPAEPTETPDPRTMPGEEDIGELLRDRDLGRLKLPEPIESMLREYYQAAYDYGYYRVMPPSQPGWRYCSFREHMVAEVRLRAAIRAALAATRGAP
jgi:hypothetical protein